MASHLTFEERGFLYRLKKKGKSNTEIAELMGRHRSTIGRELNRNSGQRGYRPKQANAWLKNVAWRVVDRTKWMTLTCINTSKTDWKNTGRRIKSPVVCRVSSRVHQRAGCRGKPFTIGSTTKHLIGTRCCVVVVDRRKSGEN